MRLFAEQAPGCRTLWLRPPWMFDRDERNDVPEIGYVLRRRLQLEDAQSASTQREGRPDYWQVRGSPARTSTKERRAAVPSPHCRSFCSLRILRCSFASNVAPDRKPKILKVPIKSGNEIQNSKSDLCSHRWCSFKLLVSLSLGGGTGRRTGLKIRSPARGVRVRFPSQASLSIL